MNGEGDTPAWQPAPNQPALPEGETHVWRVRLDQPSERVEAFARMLSPDEHDRASRFYFSRHREWSIVGRGSLRMILGRYLGILPRQVRLGYGALGKPHLVPTEADDLRFNVAHSEGLALYAVTRRQEIGVDLERVRALPDAEEIARRFFSPREVENFLRVAPSHRLGAFFTCWTRKEAFLKATGDGLARPLDDFDVSLAPGEPAQLLRVRDDPGAPSRWSLQDIRAGEGFAAAVAAEGRRRLVCYDVEPHGQPAPALAMVGPGSLWSPEIAKRFRGLNPGHPPGVSGHLHDRPEGGDIPPSRKLLLHHAAHGRRPWRNGGVEFLPGTVLHRLIPQISR